MDKGQELNSRVTGLGLVNELFEDARCVSFVPFNNTIDALGRFDAKILLRDE